MRGITGRGRGSARAGGLLRCVSGLVSVGVRASGVRVRVGGLGLEPTLTLTLTLTSNPHQALTKDFGEPLTHTHFSAEGEVALKS